MAHVNHVQSNSMGVPHKRNFLDKMNGREKGMSIFAVLLLFWGVPAFISLILALVVISSVSNREKNVVRIYHSLQYQPNTTVSALSNQLQVSGRKVDEALKVMILDLNYPVRYDIAAGKVDLVNNETETHTPQTYPDTVEVPVDFAEPPVQSQPVTPVQPQVQPLIVSQPVVHQAAPPAMEVPAKKPVSSCVQCGTKLPVTAKYCNACGVRQLS